jgi:hypothetical protein
MAKARQTETEKIVKVTGIVLELTEEEAKALYALTMRAGGSPDTSPRKHIDSIRRALTEAVYADSTGRCNSVDEYRAADQWAQPEYTLAQGGGGVIFKDYEKEPE